MRLNFFILVLAAITGIAPLARAEPTLVNAIAARVNDAVITYQDLSEVTRSDEKLYFTQYGSNPQLLRQKLEQLQQDALELLVARRLILDEFKSAGYQLPDKVVEDQIKSQVRDRFGDRVTMIKSLQREGLTIDTYKQRVREELIVGAMTSKHVGREIIISPYKVEKHYTENRDRFKVEDELILRMIFFGYRLERDAAATRKLAAEVAARIDAGEPFAEMARAHSDGLQRSEGGLMPPIKRGTLREELDRVIFSLNPGRRSDVVETPEGCYLLLVEKFRPAHVRPLNEVRGEIERQLQTEEQQQLHKQWIQRLKDKSFVKYYPAG